MPKYNRQIEEVDGDPYETWTNRSGTIKSGQLLYPEYDDYSEEGCSACGNPAYPDCKDSCPLFDD